MNPDSVVIGSVIVITGTSVVKHVHEHTFTFRPIITGFLLGAALLLVAMASPSLARALALLGLVGGLITNGPAVISLVQGVTK